jgi:hypothetical protein
VELNIVPKFFRIGDENREGDDEQSRGDQNTRRQKDVDQHIAKLLRLREFYGLGR